MADITVDVKERTIGIKDLIEVRGRDPKPAPISGGRPTILNRVGPISEKDGHLVGRKIDGDPSGGPTL